MANIHATSHRTTLFQGCKKKISLFGFLVLSMALQGYQGALAETIVGSNIPIPPFTVYDNPSTPTTDPYGDYNLNVDFNEFFFKRLATASGTANGLSPIGGIIARAILEGPPHVAAGDFFSPRGVFDGHAYITHSNSGSSGVLDIGVIGPEVRYEPDVYTVTPSLNGLFYFPTEGGAGQLDLIGSGPVGTSPISTGYVQNSLGQMTASCFTIPGNQLDVFLAGIYRVGWTLTFALQGNVAVFFTPDPAALVASAGIPSSNCILKSPISSPVLASIGLRNWGGTGIIVEVPGPAPLFGVATALVCARRIRTRIKGTHSGGGTSGMVL